MEAWLHLATLAGVLNVLIYLRVSTEEQALRGFSLPEQRRACLARAEQIAAEIGLELRVKEFEDHDSGEILNRPVLDAVRDYIRGNQVHVFVCLDPDRFARKLFLQLLVTEDIERTGCRLEFVQHNYEKTAEGKLFYQIRGAVSEFEKAKILERMRRGKLGALRQGRIPHHMRVYGYRYVAGTGTLEIEPAEASWVQQMFRWVTEEHLGALRVAERLNEVGVPAPRGNWWYRASMYKLLRNGTYTGRLALNRADWTGVRFNRFRAKEDILRPVARDEEEWHEVDVPQIVSLDTWAEAQRILGAVRRRKARQGSKLHLLSGLCRCGLCGAPVHYVTGRNRLGTVYRWLRCSQRDPRTQALKPDRWGYRCSLPHVRADEVDQWIREQIHAWIKEPDILRQRLEREKAAPGTEERSAIEAELTLLREQVRALDHEEDNLLSLLQKGLGQREKLETRLADLSRQMATLQARIRHLSEQTRSAPTTETLLATLERVRDQVLHRLADMQLEDWQHLIRSIVRQVVISGTSPEHWDLEF